MRKARLAEELKGNSRSSSVSFLNPNCLQSYLVVVWNRIFGKPIMAARAFSLACLAVPRIEPFSYLAFIGC
jgi:hypothetical protein